MREALDNLEYPLGDAGNAGRAELARATVPPQVGRLQSPLPSEFLDCFPLLWSACPGFSFDELERAVHFLLAEVQERMASRQRHRYRAPLQSRRQDLLVVLVRLRPALWTRDIQNKYIPICQEVYPADSADNLKQAVKNIYGGIRGVGCRLYATEYGVLLALDAWARSAGSRINAPTVNRAQQALASWRTELQRRARFLDDTFRNIQALSRRARESVRMSCRAAEKGDEGLSRAHCNQALDDLRGILMMAKGQSAHVDERSAAPELEGERAQGEPLLEAISLAYPGPELYSDWLNKAYARLKQRGDAKTWADLAQDARERIPKIAGDVSAARRESEVLYAAIETVATAGDAVPESHNPSQVLP
jgi:hypothetical protein